MIRPFSLLLFLALACPLRADVRPHGFFGDHMVLQRDTPVPVWGRADPGEEVAVTFRDETAMARADANGEWKTTLPKVAPGQPALLTIRGKNTVTFQNVLVGDVWLCSGQSNMAASVSSVENAAAEMAAANLPEVRHIRAELRTADQPRTDFEGRWAVCTPATAKEFSAVAFFFARKINADLGVPIGIVNCTWGGTSATAWMSAEALTDDPGVARQWAKTLADFPAAQIRHVDALAAWEKADADARATGRPFAQKKPVAPAGPGDRNTPGGL